jgi:hypothetical protein
VHFVQKGFVNESNCTRSNPIDLSATMTGIMRPVGGGTASHKQ